MTGFPFYWKSLFGYKLDKYIQKTLEGRSSLLPLKKNWNSMNRQHLQIHLLEQAHQDNPFIPHKPQPPEKSLSPSFVRELGPLSQESLVPSLHLSGRALPLVWAGGGDVYRHLQDCGMKILQTYFKIFFDPQKSLSLLQVVDRLPALGVIKKSSSFVLCLFFQTWSPS